MNKIDKKLILIQSGLKLMHLKGYNGTGIQQIVDAVSLPKGSFYSYFDSKENFAIELIQHYSNEQFSFYSSILKNDTQKSLQRINALFNKLADNYVAKAHCSLGCFLGNMCQEMGDTSFPISKEVDLQLCKWQRLLKICLDEGVSTGEIKSEINTDILADFILNAWQGTILRMKSTRSAKPLKVFQKSMLLFFDTIRL